MDPTRNVDPSRSVPSERGTRQRALRRGLSLRKARSGNDGDRTSYWLVTPGANSIVAGGDAGISLERIVAWLAQSGNEARPPERRQSTG